MSQLELARPGSLEDALALFASPTSANTATSEGGRLWLAGGQSLLAAMKLGMVSPSLLIDLQDVPGLRDIRLEPAAQQGLAPSLWIGAMATHASVASSAVVRGFAPGLAALAGGIADAQVRQMGTLGGSLAHNDPAACWPAGLLASGATVVTSQREVPADNYFKGLYSNALVPGEMIVGVRFAPLKSFHYVKFEQPASRFALVGVAAAMPAGENTHVRIAVTGLGLGVVRWHEAEQALGERPSVPAFEGLTELDQSSLQALGDLHASAAYRQHLARVLTGRCVVAITGTALTRPAPLARSHSAAETAGASATEPKQQETPREGFGGVQQLAASPAEVWRTLLDPKHLQTCIPGCESLTQTSPDSYEATVKVGLGPLSVRFKTEVLLREQQPPDSLTMVFRGNAGALGNGQGAAQIRLESLADDRTMLHWWVQVQLGGRLAQFGNRLVEATARKLSGEFFERIGIALRTGDAAGMPANAPSWWRRLLQVLFPSNRK
ncbi:MAG: FAD binding domain-containing protein [Pseudomonadota bacterium]